jgi:SPOR domain
MPTSADPGATAVAVDMTPKLKRMAHVASLCAVIVAMATLSACSSLHWVKTRFVEDDTDVATAAPAEAVPRTDLAKARPAAPVPTAPAAMPAPAPVPPAAIPAPVAAQTAPAPVAAPRIAVEEPRAAAPVPEKPVSTARAAAPGGVVSKAQQSLLPRSTVPGAAKAAPEVVAQAAGTPAALPAGRWAVQVGVFYVVNTADAVRARVASQLEQGGGMSPESRVTRVVPREGKFHVVVGDATDRAAADMLADRVRTTLRQQVVLFRQ